MEPTLRPHEQNQAGGDDKLPDSEPDGELPTDNVSADYVVNKQTNEFVGEIVEPKAPA
jgi:hypothetical protein